MKSEFKGSYWGAYILAWVGVFLFRFMLLAWRAPNVEPMLATIMPFAKKGGAVSSFMFGFLGIVLYDGVTSGFGMWTAITAIAYGLLGLAAYFYFKNRAASRMNFLTFGVIGTLAYDAATGLTIGPLFHGQSFMLALAGQIPFTALHLLGVIVFSTLLSPAIYRGLVLLEAKVASRQTQIA